MVRVKIPILSSLPEDHPDYDENEVIGWKTEAALVHVFQCEKTGAERIWGCEAV